MRKAVFIFIAILGIASACTHRPKPTLRSLLQEVEGMMRTAPDTVHYLLQNVLTGQTLTKEDSIYYQLLTAEVQLHNQLKIEDTAAMHNLTFYYKEKQDTLMQARAQRLYAAAHRDLGFYDATVQHYNTAIAFAREIGYKRLLADAYFELANIYYFEGLRLLAEPPRILADSLFYLTEQTAEAMKDTALWINSLLSHSLIPSGRKQYAEWERLLLSALRLSEEAGDKGHEAIASMDLSVMYGELGKKEKSFSYAQRNLTLRKGLISEYLYYLILGNAYQRIGEKDSADYYLNKGKELKEREERAKFSTPSPNLSSEFKNTPSIEQRLNQIHVGYHFNQQITKQQSKYIVLTLILLLICILIIFFIKKHHTLKEKVQQEKSEAEKERISRAYERTKNVLQQTEEQLQQEKERLQSKEEQLTALQQELEVLSSDTLHVFDKINLIVKDYLYKDRSELRMEETDWRQLQIEIDKQWDHAATQLEKEFRLKASEVRLLCLNLTNLPTSHIPFLFDRGRNTIYVKTRKLCKKLGVTRQSDTFKEDFKKFIESRKALG